MLGVFFLFLLLFIGEKLKFKEVIKDRLSFFLLGFWIFFEKLELKVKLVGMNFWDFLKF